MRKSTNLNTLLPAIMQDLLVPSADRSGRNAVTMPVMRRRLILRA